MPKEDAGGVLLESNLPLPLENRGKVRDIYSLPTPGRADQLLFVATDRISAFDCVLASGIPGKGRVLTQMSLFWFDFFRDVIGSHLVSADIASYPAELRPFAQQLLGRSMIVRRASMIPVECVARGYLAGSGWKEYITDGTVCGISLPAGLVEGARLPEPIFTPAMKAHQGHDLNVSFEYVADQIGAELAGRLRDLTLEIYNRAAGYALGRGIILADTKFEFGWIDDQLCLADEVLTPDSSRWWPAETYRPGGAQPSYDKQFVRDYLETIAWNKQPPAPALPDDVVRKTSAKYFSALKQLTGSDQIRLENAPI